jgi:hypothetical protein
MSYEILGVEEWFTAAIMVGAAWVCFRAGVGSSRRARPRWNGPAAVAVAATLGAAAAHYPPFRDVAGPWLAVPGGEASLACLGASVLLGIAWSQQKPDSSRLLVAMATALVFLLLAALGSGSLIWHYGGQRLRANYPDARGMLQQTTGITCAPAAASMMLYQSGIRVSEGELAERAGTNPLQGTAPYALARAVDCVARRNGKRGCVRRVDYAQVSLLGRPFVAFMNRPGVGGHALCVLKVDEEQVRVIDPLSGSPDTITREEFVAEWDPVIVWVDGNGAQRALRRVRTARLVVYCPLPARKGGPVREVAEFATTGC